MFTKGISEQLQRNLETLSRIQFVKKYYLAGKTALSLHLGHRFSYDLDFFTQEVIKPRVITAGLKEKGSLEILQNEEGTFIGQFNGVKLSFFVYPYKLLEPTVLFQKVNIASVDDIACMKLDAISSRGTKRDFVDLYLILQKRVNLTRLFELFEKKYAGVEYNKLYLIKSLVYFADADVEEMPEMVIPVKCGEVKKFFVSEVSQKWLAGLR